MLVKVIKAGHSEYQRKYIEDNNLRFVRIDANSFKVEQLRSFDHGSYFILIGEVFSKKAIWVFIPDRCHNRPQTWYFGNTRSDAVSGYIDFLKSSGKKIPDQKEV